MYNLRSLRIIKESGPTRLELVRDLDQGCFYVEKSLIVNIDWQKVLFENEVRIHSSLNHRYITSFVHRNTPQSYLMEYAENGNLQNFISKNSDDKILIKLIFNFLKGLEYLHQMGLVHNDIKPSNILVGKNMRAKLSDFAFCGKIGERTFQNPPDYFFWGTQSFRPRSNPLYHENLVCNDIYATGVVLYILFSRDQGGKEIQIDLIENSTVRSIVDSCLNGTITSVGQIMECLNHI